VVLLALVVNILAAVYKGFEVLKLALMVKALDSEVIWPYRFKTC
jgi:hypothetical protein